MAYSLSLTAEQRSEFERAGALFIPGYFPADDMARMADAVWTDMHQRFGIDRERPETWTTERPAKFQKLIRSGAFRALGSERLFAIGDAFFGAGAWEMPKRFGFPLVTFAAAPAPERAKPLWHTDIPPSMSVEALCCMRIFTFLEPVHPRGGGTLFIEGSHRLAMKIAGRTPGETVRSADVRETLGKENCWFADLFRSSGEDIVARFSHSNEMANGVDVRVREMTGEAGGLVLMHPAMLHAGTENHLRSPRMMLTEWLWRSGAQLKDLPEE